MASTDYTLYYNTWSVYSQMVLLTFAFRGQPKDAQTEMAIKKQEVDIFKGAQVEEVYLTEINPKGQVPVLTNSHVLPKPIADSLDITYHIAKHYPSLLPEEKKHEIIELLRKPAEAYAQKAAVEAKIAQPGISERYRKALEFKMTIVQNEKINGVTPTEIETQKRNTTTVLDKIVKLYDSASGPWLWGRTSPTALDVHLAIFLARLHDVGHAVLVPEPLVAFYHMTRETKEWGNVYQGRKTIIGV